MTPAMESSLPPLGTRHLLAFFGTSFAITWSLGGIYLVAREPLEACFGPVEGAGHPLFMLAVYAPAIAAFATLAVARGRAGLAAYARRFLHWKAHPGWYAAVLLGIPASMLAARAIVLAGGGTLDPWPAAGWTTLLGVALLELVRDPGPVEEVGWRGFALPLLQRRMSAAAASAVLGVVWGVWHLPAFFVQGAPQDGYPFVGFVVGSVAVSLLMTAVYNGTRGSIPLAFLFHYATNDPLAIGKQAVALPWLAIVALLGALALARLGPARLGSHKITDVWQGMTP